MLACLGTYQGKELLDSVIGVCLILNMSNCLPVCWIILHSYQPVFKSHFTFTFQQNPWLPTYIFPWWNRKNIWTSEKLQDSVSLPVWTQANLFWARSVIWAFCQLVLTCIWHRRQFVSRVSFGHFVNWFWCVSDVKDHLWAWSTIWTFLPIDLTCVYHWGSVCERWVLFGHFANWSDLCHIRNCLCWASVYLVIFLGDLWQSVFWCVSIYSICVTGVIVVFCKMGTTGWIH